MRFGLVRRAWRKLGIRRLYQAPIYALINRMFFEKLIQKTNNFSGNSWLGKPIWQNILDLWIIQETIWDGVTDVLPIFRSARPGPLPAIRAF